MQIPGCNLRLTFQFEIRSHLKEIPCYVTVTMRSEQKRQRGVELRGVVKPLVFFGGQFAVLALCYLFSRQVMNVATRKGDMLYTYRVVAFCRALWR